jgi:hypothetical protein
VQIELLQSKGITAMAFRETAIQTEGCKPLLDFFPLDVIEF